MVLIKIPQRVLGQKQQNRCQPPFFADNDIIAFGALSAFKEFGINVPKDLSIVGFDDMPYCEISDPKTLSLFM